MIKGGMATPNAFAAPINVAVVEPGDVILISFRLVGPTMFWGLLNPFSTILYMRSGEYKISYFVHISSKRVKYSSIVSGEDAAARTDESPFGWEMDISGCLHIRLYSQFKLNVFFNSVFPSHCF